MLFEDASQRRGEDLDPNSQEANRRLSDVSMVLTRTTVRRGSRTTDSFELPKKVYSYGIRLNVYSIGPSFSRLPDGKNGCK